MLELIANIKDFYVIIYESIPRFVNHWMKLVKNRCTACGVAWTDTCLTQLMKKVRIKYLTNLRHNVVEVQLERELRI